MRNERYYLSATSRVSVRPYLLRIPHASLEPWQAFVCTPHFANEDADSGSPRLLASRGAHRSRNCKSLVGVADGCSMLRDSSHVEAFLTHLCSDV